MINKIRHSKMEDIPISHKNEHEGYEYFKRKFVAFGETKNTLVCVYEIPPMKSTCPYHYHGKSEETFYIISGKGLLRTPDGERVVEPGELLFFPAGIEGAHKITNCSATESLVYIDFDVVHDLDVAVYPDSNKIGVWGMGMNQMFRKLDDVDYYDGE